MRLGILQGALRNSKDCGRIVEGAVVNGLGMVKRVLMGPETAQNYPKHPLDAYEGPPRRANFWFQIVGRAERAIERSERRERSAVDAPWNASGPPS